MGFVLVLIHLSRRKFNYHHRSDFDHSGPRQFSRGFRGGRGPGRSRDSSPPYGRGRGGGGRFSGRDFDRPRFDPRPFKGGEGSFTRNNPNVSPREGDWICPDPLCGNLNFARRESCNKCNRLRIGPRDGTPQRIYQEPPRFSGLPVDGSLGRGGPNGYHSSPPCSWGRDRDRDGPREFRGGQPYTRREGRFSDNNVRRGRPDYYHDEDDLRDRAKFDRPMAPDFRHRDRGRDTRRNDRRSLSPPPPHRPVFGRDTRERSQSPMRNGARADYLQNSYPNRGVRDDDLLWGRVRDRVNDHLY